MRANKNTFSLLTILLLVLCPAYVQATNHTEAWITDSLGRVGIGTNEPIRELDVRGSVIIQAHRPTLTLRHVGPESSGTIEFGGTTSRWLMGSVQQDAPHFIIRRHNTTGAHVDSPLIIDSNTGNVGIKRHPGSHALDVWGSGRFTGHIILESQGIHATHAVRADRRISSGTGLVGGGDLTQNREISIDTEWLDQRYIPVESQAIQELLEEIALLRAQVNALSNNPTVTSTTHKAISRTEHGVVITLS